MKTLFVPAVWLIGHLSYRYKLLLTAVVFLLPLLLFAGLLMSEHQGQLEVTRQERAGLALQLPALELLAAAHDYHAALQVAAAGDESYRQAQVERRARVTERLQGVHDLTRAGFDETLAGAAWVPLREHWEKPSGGGEDAADVLNAQLEFNRLLRQGVTLVSDRSGIRADGDPTVAALVDSLSIKLPLLLESLGVARDDLLNKGGRWNKSVLSGWGRWGWGLRRFSRRPASR